MVVLRTWSIGELLILAIVIAACIAIAAVAIRYFGFAIPQWAIQIFLPRSLIPLVAERGIRFFLTIS